MSYQRFAEYELKLVNADASTTAVVLALIKLSGANEHSGRSISVYHDYIRAVLARGAVDHLPDDLKPAFADVDVTTPEGKELIANAMFLFNAVINFEPLSPLTGEDSEWVDVGRDGQETVYQNRRLSTVFKEGDKAYRIGHTLFSYPTHDYGGWCQVDRGKELSSQTVTFPYDTTLPENQIQFRYFTNESWSSELPSGVEPQAWLRWLRKRYLIGIDPTTNKVRPNVMFVNYDDIAKITTMLRNLLCYVKYTEGQPREAVKEQLNDLCRFHAHFTLEWTEPESEGDGINQYKAVFTNPIQAGRLLRLLELIPDDVDYMVGSEDDAYAPFFIDCDHNEYLLTFVNLLTPTGRYQGWEHGGQYVLVFANRGEGLEPFFLCDDHYQVLGDADEYLYQKRREHGYAHPRGRGTLHFKVMDDCPTPVEAVNTIVAEFQGEGLDKQEGEQIDNAVAKHVKHVFGTNKKD